MGRYGGLHPNDDAGHAMYEEQRTHGGPDPNPLMPCHGCRENYRWGHYKNHGKAPEKPGDDMLCAACNGFGTVGTNSVEARRENNRDLEEFTSG